MIFSKLLKGLMPSGTRDDHKLDTIDLEQSQWWPLENLEEFQRQRLRLIIHYAYGNIPAYREKMKVAGVKPGDIKSKDHLWKLPITTREEMQNNDAFVNKHLITQSLCTGGSNGSPLHYYESEFSGKIRWSSHWRGWSWNGYRQGKRLAVISSAQGVVEENNTLNLTGDLTTENLRLNIEKLQKFKPQHIRGYVSSIYILAKYCIDNFITVEGIESIDPISENLYDFQREAIEAAFNCKVFEEYCCNDGGACAWECDAHEGLHYVMERSIIEDIDGDMIVTDLWNLAMPFIRYANGDSVKFLNQKCSCGRELPLIKVKGRTNDVIISSNGPISPTYLISNTKMYAFRSVQYVQKPGFILEVNVVKNPWCTDDDIIDFNGKLTKVIPGMKIIVNFVEEMPKTLKGKRSFVINEDKELLDKYSAIIGKL